LNFEEKKMTEEHFSEKLRGHSAKKNFRIAIYALNYLG
jgi:hypothetical protein